MDILSCSDQLLFYLFEGFLYLKKIFPQVSRVQNPGELMIVGVQKLTNIQYMFGIIMDHHHERGIQN